jgi:hypothetical protein
MNLLDVALSVGHIPFKEIDLLFVDSILIGKFLDKFNNKGVLAEYDLIHAHTNFVESFVEINLIGFKLIYFYSHFVAFVIY